MKLGHKRLRLLGEIAMQPQGLRYPPAVVRHDSSGRVYREGDDFRGLGARDLLNVHAAGCRRNECDARAFAIDQRGQIELAFDRRAFLDIEAIDLLAVRTGLVRDQNGAEQAFCLPVHVFRRPYDLDSTRLAASAGVDLRLDHQHGRCERVRCFDRLLDRESGKPARHRHVEIPEQRLGLIFVDVHAELYVGLSEAQWRVFR